MTSASFPVFSFVSFSVKTDRKSDKHDPHLHPGKLLNLLKTTPLSLPTGANKSLFSAQKLLNTLINTPTPPSMRRRDHGGKMRYILFS